MTPVDRLDAYGTRTTAAAGATIFFEGDTAGVVFGVIAGRVRIEVVTPSGGRLVLAVKEPGDLFGELGALDGRPRSAAAIALERVELLQVPVGGFIDAIEREPGLAVGLLRRLSSDLRLATDRTTARNSADTTTRLAMTLHDLAERFGEHNGGNVSIELPLTQEDLAGWIGATREATSRSLRVLREAGCVKTARRRITIVDIAMLQTSAISSP